MNQKNNKKINLEIALIINKELYEEKRITYKVFENTEKQLLKQLKELG